MEHMNNFAEEYTLDEQINLLLENPAQLESLCINSDAFATSPAAQNMKLLTANNWEYATYLSKYQPLWHETAIAQDSDFLVQAPGHIIKNIIVDFDNTETIGELPSKCWSKDVFDSFDWLKSDFNENGVPCNANGQDSHSVFTFSQMVWLAFYVNKDIIDVPEFFAHPDFVEGLYFSDLDSIVRNDTGEDLSSRKCIQLVDMLLANINELSSASIHRLLRVGYSQTAKSPFSQSLARALANNAIPLTEQNLTSVGYLGTDTKLLAQYSSRLLVKVKDQLASNSLTDASPIPHLLCLIQTSLTPHNSLSPPARLQEASGKILELLAGFAINQQGQGAEAALSAYTDTARYPLAIKAVDEVMIKSLVNEYLGVLDVTEDEFGDWQPNLY